MLSQTNSKTKDLNFLLSIYYLFFYIFSFDFSKHILKVICFFLYLFSHFIQLSLFPLSPLLLLHPFFSLLPNYSSERVRFPMGNKHSLTYHFKARPMASTCTQTEQGIPSERMCSKKSFQALGINSGPTVNTLQIA